MNYDLLFAGKPFNPQLREYLMSVMVKDEIGLLSDSVDVVFSYDPKLPDFDLGMLMSVKLGVERKLWDTGQYYISEVNLQGPPHELTVRGLSSPFILVKALQNHHERAWQHDEVTLSEMMEKVVREAGFKFEFNAPDERMPITLQIGESDGEFLTRIGRLRDLRFKVSDDKIVVFKTDASVNLSGVPLKTVKVRYVGETMKYTYRRNEQAYQSAKAYAQNLQAGEPDIIEVGSGEPKFTFKETFGTVKQAESACQAKLAEHDRNTRVASITLPGQPDIIAGGTMILSDFPREMNDKKFLIETVTHNFSSTGGYTIYANLVHTDD